MPKYTYFTTCVIRASPNRHGSESAPARRAQEARGGRRCDVERACQACAGGEEGRERRRLAVVPCLAPPVPARPALLPPPPPPPPPLHATHRKLTWSDTSCCAPPFRRSRHARIQLRPPSGELSERAQERANSEKEDCPGARDIAAAQGERFKRISSPCTLFTVCNTRSSLRVRSALFGRRRLPLPSCSLDVAAVLGAGHRTERPAATPRRGSRPAVLLLCRAAPVAGAKGGATTAAAAAVSV